MKMKSVIFFGVALCSMLSPALETTVDGVTLTYVVKSGTAIIGNGTSAAITNSTSGVFTIPTTIYRQLTDTTYTVTAISANAFNGCRSLTSVVIPPAVTNIGKQAFYECTSLSSLSLPRGLKTIGDYAFSNTSSLTNIFLPSQVTSVGEKIFGEKKENATYYAPVALRAGGKLDMYDPIYYGGDTGRGTLVFDPDEKINVVDFRVLSPGEFAFAFEGRPINETCAANLMAQQIGVLRAETLDGLRSATFGIDDIRDFAAEDLPDGRVRARFRAVLPDVASSPVMFFKLVVENP